jgi:hypothetical protein
MVAAECPTHAGELTPTQPASRIIAAEQEDGAVLCTATVETKTDNTSTPTPGEAARRLAKFTDIMWLKRATPIITSPPKQPPIKKAIIPWRSRRIAAQEMGHIPVSKRGEVLAMRKMGFIHPTAHPTSADRRNYDSFFNKTLTEGEIQAMDELLPATRPRGGRAGRRPIPVAA